MMMENIKQILNENGRTISNKDRGLASMMDNEPRTEDRSPEGQMFSLESEIKNLMKEYEIAVRDGDNERAQRIADIINELDAQKIDIQNEMSNEGRGDIYNLDRSNLYNLRLRQSLGSGNIDDIKSEQKDIRNSALQEIDSIQTSGMLDEYPEYYTKEIEKLRRYSMAEGGEAEMLGMSEQEAMAELEAAGPDFEIVEQLIGAVVQMIQQGVSEAEVKEFLREQGLDDEDIEELFKMVMERLQQASAEEPIGKELQGMM